MMRSSCRWCLCLAFALGYLGCKSRPAEAEPPQQVEPFAKDNASPDAGVVPVKYPDEVYGDPEIFREPRLQFLLWHSHDETPGIYSMRLDGTDVRLAAGPELLESIGATTIDEGPLRSPDNRFIVFKRGMTVGLIDLKEHKSKIIGRGGFRPHFQWTRDSRKIIFYHDAELVEYDVAKEKLTTLNDIYSRGFYLMESRKEILAINSWGLFFYDLPDLYKKMEKRDPDRIPFLNEPGERDLKYKRKVKVSRHNNIHGYHAISPDCSLLVYQEPPMVYVVKVDDPAQPVMEINDDLQEYDKHLPLNLIMGPDNRTIYMHGFNNSIDAFDIKTKQRRIVRDFGQKGGKPAAPSLFNMKDKGLCQ